MIVNAGKLGPAFRPKGGLTLTLCFHRLRFEEAADGLGRLGAAPDPVVHPLALEHDLGGIPAGVVVPEDFHEAAVTSHLAFDHDDPVRTLLFGSCASQAYLQQSDPLHFDDKTAAKVVFKDAPRKRLGWYFT
jgi:hypothetical protein